MTLVRELASHVGRRSRNGLGVGAARKLGWCLAIPLVMALAAGCSGDAKADGAKGASSGSPKVSAAASSGVGSEEGASGSGSDSPAPSDPAGITAPPTVEAEPDQPAPPEPTGQGIVPPKNAPKVGPSRGAPPSNAKVPKVDPPLESHPGDKDNFYVDTDDYVVWARPSKNTSATLEYRVVCFSAEGIQSVAFLKYVFATEAEAKDFAKTNDLLIRNGAVVYYKGWLGANAQEKAGVIAIAKAEATDYYVSKP